MRRAVLCMMLAGLGATACNDLNGLNSTEPIPVQVTGIVRLEGSPVAAEVTLADSRFTGDTSDDVQLAQERTGADGIYGMAAFVPRRDCGNLYIGAAPLDYWTVDQNGDTVPVFFGDSENLNRCGSVAVDFDIQLPAGVFKRAP